MPTGRNYRNRLPHDNIVHKLQSLLIVFLLILICAQRSHAVDWASAGRILKSGAQTLHNTAKSVCNGVICAVSSNSQQEAQPNQVEKKENESADGGQKSSLTLSTRSSYKISKTNLKIFEEMQQKAAGKQHGQNQQQQQKVFRYHTDPVGSKNLHYHHKVMGKAHLNPAKPKDKDHAQLTAYKISDANLKVFKDKHEKASGMHHEQNDQHHKIIRCNSEHYGSNSLHDHKPTEKDPTSTEPEFYDVFEDLSESGEAQQHIPPPLKNQKVHVKKTGGHSTHANEHPHLQSTKNQPVGENGNPVKQADRKKYGKPIGGEKLDKALEKKKHANDGHAKTGPDEMEEEAKHMENSPIGTQDHQKMGGEAGNLVLPKTLVNSNVNKGHNVKAMEGPKVAQIPIKGKTRNKQKKAAAARQRRQKKRRHKIKAMQSLMNGNMSIALEKPNESRDDKVARDKANRDKGKGENANTENANEENAKRENSKHYIPKHGASENSHQHGPFPKHEFKNGKLGEHLDPRSVFNINFSDEYSSSSSETVEETGKEKEHSDLNNHDKKVLGRMLSDSQLIMRGNGKTGQEKLDHSKGQEKHQNSNILTNHVEWHKQDQLQLVLHQPHYGNKDSNLSGNLVSDEDKDEVQTHGKSIDRSTPYPSFTTAFTRMPESPESSWESGEEDEPVVQRIENIANTQAINSDTGIEVEKGGILEPHTHHGHSHYHINDNDTFEMTKLAANVKSDDHNAVKIQKTEILPEDKMPDATGEHMGMEVQANTAIHGNKGHEHGHENGEGNQTAGELEKDAIKTTEKQDVKDPKIEGETVKEVIKDEHRQSSMPTTLETKSQNGENSILTRTQSAPAKNSPHSEATMPTTSHPHHHKRHHHGHTPTAGGTAEGPATTEQNDTAKAPQNKTEKENASASLGMLPTSPEATLTDSSKKETVDGEKKTEGMKENQTNEKSDDKAMNEAMNINEGIVTTTKQNYEKMQLLDFGGPTQPINYKVYAMTKFPDSIREISIFNDYHHFNRPRAAKVFLQILPLLIDVFEVVDQKKEIAKGSNDKMPAGMNFTSKKTNIDEKKFLTLVVKFRSHICLYINDQVCPGDANEAFDILEEFFEKVENNRWEQLGNANLGKIYEEFSNVKKFELQKLMKLDSYKDIDENTIKKDYKIMDQYFWFIFKLQKENIGFDYHERIKRMSLIRNVKNTTEEIQQNWEKLLTDEQKRFIQKIFEQIIDLMNLANTRARIRPTEFTDLNLYKFNDVLSGLGMPKKYGLKIAHFLMLHYMEQDETEFKKSIADITEIRDRLAAMHTIYSDLKSKKGELNRVKKVLTTAKNHVKMTKTIRDDKKEEEEKEIDVLIIEIVAAEKTLDKTDANLEFTLNWLAFIDLKDENRKNAFDMLKNAFDLFIKAEKELKERKQFFENKIQEAKKKMDPKTSVIDAKNKNLLINFNALKAQLEGVDTSPIERHPLPKIDYEKIAEKKAEKDEKEISSMGSTNGQLPSASPTPPIPLPPQLPRLPVWPPLSSSESPSPPSSEVDPPPLAETSLRLPSAGGSPTPTLAKPSSGSIPSPPPPPEQPSNNISIPPPPPPPLRPSSGSIPPPPPPPAQPTKISIPPPPPPPSLRPLSGTFPKHSKALPVGRIKREIWLEHHGSDPISSFDGANSLLASSKDPQANESKKPV